MLCRGSRNPVGCVVDAEEDDVTGRVEDERVYRLGVSVWGVVSMQRKMASHVVLKMIGIGDVRDKTVRFQDGGAAEQCCSTTEPGGEDSK